VNQASTTVSISFSWTLGWALDGPGAYGTEIVFYAAGA
jgi:hypothetical protein